MSDIIIIIILFATLGCSVYIGVRNNRTYVFYDDIRERVYNRACELIGKGEYDGNINYFAAFFENCEYDKVVYSFKALKPENFFDEKRLAWLDGGPMFDIEHPEKCLHWPMSDETPEQD